MCRRRIPRRSSLPVPAGWRYLAQRMFGEALGRGSRAQFDLREVAVGNLSEAGRHGGPLGGLDPTGVRSAEPPAPTPPRRPVTAPQVGPFSVSAEHGRSPRRSLFSRSDGWR